jgi:hypothetical protein
MQSETHNTEHGHDVTAAAEENIRSGLVFGWGLGMFIAVLISIGFLTGYFWSKRDLHFGVQVGEVSTFGNAGAELDKAVKARLEGYKALGNGRYQIPIDEAKKKLVEEGL